MQKIVVDTNVIVSALIQKSYPFLIIYDLFIERQFQLCVSDDLLAEYYEVLARPKFSKFPDFFLRSESLLANIALQALKYAPSNKVNLISDKDDNMILELAEECSANFIITGNSTDFTFPAYKSTMIVSPREYWDYYRPA